MDRNSIYQNRNSLVIQSIILIVIGVVLIVWSGFVLNFIVQLIGATIIGIGIISIISHYAIKRRYPEVRKMAPIESYVSIVFGIILIIFPQFFISILMSLLGLSVIFGSLSQIYSLIQLKRASYNFSGALFISPILMLIIGVLIIANPFDFAKTILIEIFGAFMLIYGITSILRYSISQKSRVNI